MTSSTVVHSSRDCWCEAMMCSELAHTLTSLVLSSSQLWQSQDCSRGAIARSAPFPTPQILTVLSSDTDANIPLRTELHATALIVPAWPERVVTRDPVARCHTYTCRHTRHIINGAPSSPSRKLHVESLILPAWPAKKVSRKSATRCHT